MSLKVSIAGLDFHGEGRKGPLVIGADGFTGWDEGVAMRQENVIRPGAHGSYNLPVYQDARVVSVSGNVVADSPADLAHLRNRLTGLLAGGQQGRIQVTRPWGTQWADCRLGGQTRFSERGGTSTGTFQVQLWCPDPRKYGNMQDFVVTNGTVSAYHWGNTDAHPMVVVRGSAPGGYDVSGPGGELFRVTAPLEDGRPHRIDFNDGLIRVDGLFQAGKVRYADVWPIPPGKETTFTVAPLTTGTAEITVTVTDTFI